MRKKAAVRPAGIQPVSEILRLHPVLQKLGDQRFHLPEGTLFPHRSAEHRQIISTRTDHAFQDERFSEISENRTRIASGLSEDTPRQTIEGQDIDIQKAVPGMHRDQILLSLHRELFRHNHDIIPLRAADRFIDQFLIYRIRFSGAAAAGYDFQ